MARVSSAIEQAATYSWNVTSPSTPSESLEMSPSCVDDPFSVNTESVPLQSEGGVFSPRTSRAYSASHSMVAGHHFDSSEDEPAPIDYGSPLSLQPQLMPVRQIAITLEGADLWHQFFQAGTEMIITRAGRRMFPGIVIAIAGLEAEGKYVVSLEIRPADSHRYKYINSKWVVVGKGDAHNKEQMKYTHPDSPATGRHWMANKVSFKKIKVTNNKIAKRGNVILNSMHRYMPTVVVSRKDSKKESTIIFTQELEECSFIGVTAYQNDQVTQLKIEHNPFAKAFRDGVADQDMYSSPGWSPISPAVPPYPQAFSADGHSPLMMPALPSPLPGHSPLPQFASAFGNWESPPYSPISPYRPHLPSTNIGPLPSQFADQRHLPWSTTRLQQESPPVSPLLYSPNMYTQQHPSFYQFPGVPDPSSFLPGGGYLKSPSTLATTSASAAAPNFHQWPSMASAAKTTPYLSDVPVGYGYEAKQMVLSHPPLHYSAAFNTPRLEDVHIHSPETPGQNITEN